VASASVFSFGAMVKDIIIKRIDINSCTMVVIDLIIQIDSDYLL
jgi:hypothetical protein